MPGHSHKAPRALAIRPPRPAPPAPVTQALGLRPEDVFTAEMLAEAMEESSALFEQQLRVQSHALQVGAHA